MTRAWTAVAALACVAAPAVAQSPPDAIRPVDEDASAYLLALAGREPYWEIWRTGAPLPPVRAEVRRLDAVRLQRERLAIKRTLLQRDARMLDERHRITEENLRECRALAEKLGAPRAFVAQLGVLAEGGMSRRRRHVVETSLSLLLDAYDIDVREVRYFVEGAGLSPDQIRELAAWLPLDAVFERAPGEELTEEDAVTCVRDIVATRRAFAEAYAAVKDRAGADAAAEALRPTLARQRLALARLLRMPAKWVERAFTREATELPPLEKTWATERQRVNEADHFGSTRLRAVDYFAY